MDLDKIEFPEKEIAEGLKNLLKNYPKKIDKMDVRRLLINNLLQRELIKYASSECLCLFFGEDEFLIPKLDRMMVERGYLPIYTHHYELA